jgi:hypothetical protein
MEFGADFSGLAGINPDKDLMVNEIPGAVMWHEMATRLDLHHER